MTALMDTAPAFALELRTVDASSARRARHWLAWVLEAARLPQDTVDAAVLVVSELVTNAVLHTDSPRILVSVQATGTGLRIVVHDDAQPVDWRQPGAPLDERGRGLILVRALADVEVDRHPGGTTVTALIRTAS